MMMSLSAKPSSSRFSPSSSCSQRLSTVSNGGSCRLLPQSSCCTSHSLVIESRLGGTTRKKQSARVPTRRTSSFPIIVYSAKREFGAVVSMVDPVEAKRLAAKQMADIRARDALKRKRQIEAINGGWAMIGLTAGLIIEARTGKGILRQLAGYLEPILQLIHTLNIPLDLSG